MFPVSTAWVRFANSETSQLMKFAGGMDPALLRRVLLDALREAHGFPLRTEFRGLVVGERALATAAPVPDGLGKATLLTAERRYLELVPTGYTEDTLTLLGPILVPTDRPLQEGSLLTVRVTLQDPGSPYAPAAGAMVGEDVEALRVHVAVEP